MKRVHHTFPPRTPNVSALMTTLALATAILAAPASAASAASPPTGAHVMTVAAHSSVESRISSLHSRLRITAAQETLWQPVAQVMRDNAGTMDTLRQTRLTNMGSMNAIDDLKSYGEVADAHADGIRKMTPVFQALYDTMSEAQKRNADQIFRGKNHHMPKKG